MPQLENRPKNQDPEETKPQEPSKTKRGTPMILLRLLVPLRLIFKTLKELFKKVIQLQSSTDVEGTIKGIKAGIVIKGYNIWILIAAAVLACIGLDTNSVAVIIGAMLISPLMSPILGIGLSIGINDNKTLQNALFNFTVATFVSLFTAFIYFLLSPLGRETTEMAARTKPTILDIAVGLFGGVAGIVAGSRKDKTNAIPGVAIATALMPPLCVAGFGLAKFNLPYFAGAFYLFFLNAVFISLSTFLVVRFLKFPLVEKYTESFNRNFTRGVVAFVLVSMVPAVWLFIDVVIDSRRDSKVQSFITEKFGPERIEFSVEKREIIETDTVDYLRVTVASPVYLPKDTIIKYNEELKTKYGLNNMELLLIQTSADPNNFKQVLQQAENQTATTLDDFRHEQQVSEERRVEITRLQQEIDRLKQGEVPLLEIRDDLRDMVPELKQAEFGQLRTATLADSAHRHNPATDQSEFVLRLTWKDSLPATIVQDRKARLLDRLQNKYRLKQIVFLDVNTPFKKSK